MIAPPLARGKTKHLCSPHEIDASFFEPQIEHSSVMTLGRMGWQSVKDSKRNSKSQDRNQGQQQEQEEGTAEASTSELGVERTKTGAEEAAAAGAAAAAAVLSAAAAEMAALEADWDALYGVPATKAELIQPRGLGELIRTQPTGDVDRSGNGASVATHERTAPSNTAHVSQVSIHMPSTSNGVGIKSEGGTTAARISDRSTAISRNSHGGTASARWSFFGDTAARRSLDDGWHQRGKFKAPRMSFDDQGWRHRNNLQVALGSESLSGMGLMEVAAAMEMKALEAKAETGKEEGRVAMVVKAIEAEANVVAAVLEAEATAEEEETAAAAAVAAVAAVDTEDDDALFSEAEDLAASLEAEVITEMTTQWISPVKS